VTPDNGEQFAIELSNATLTNIKGYQAEDADLTLTIDRADLEKTMMGAKPLAAQIADGTAKVRSDTGVLEKLASTMVDFDIRFEILPGTKSAAEVEDLSPYEVGPIDIHGEQRSSLSRGRRRMQYLRSISLALAFWLSGCTSQSRF
jgi:hypothetical protein